jgi:hypothetical protein
MELTIMMNGLEEQKLIELRGKTDRQLIALISNEIDRGLESVRRHSDYAGGERVYREVSTLLPVAYGASRAERRRLERELAELGELVNGVGACAGMR